MLLILFALLDTVLGTTKIKFLGAGKHHASGHFHYKVNVPGAWDSSSTIEYFECETDACTSKYSIKNIHLQTPNTVSGGLQIRSSNNVYDIECDAACLGGKVYKYTKVEFKTSTSTNGEIVESCPGKLVNYDGTCTNDCLRKNRGVCFRAKVLCLHDTGPKTYICNAYNHSFPKCSEGRNTNTVPCRCFSSTSIDVEISAPREYCIDGKRSEDYHDNFVKEMQPIETAWQNEYVFFYPQAPLNQWYNDSKMSDVLTNYVASPYSAKPRTGKCTGEEHKIIENMIGTDNYNIKICAEACTAYSDFPSGGFRMNSDKTQCWCEKNTAGCAVDGTDNFRRWDFTDNTSSFDIILGASQGAAMAMAYMSLGNPFNKAVLFDGFKPVSLNVATLFTDVKSFLYFDVEVNSNLKDRFPLHEVHEASTGHHVPQNETIQASLKTFLDACTAVDTPYAGCTVPACTAVNTPYAGCTVHACTAVNTPYAGCTVHACTAVDTPYAGCNIDAWVLNLNCDELKIAYNSVDCYCGELTQICVSYATEYNKRCRTTCMLISNLPLPPVEITDPNTISIAEGYKLFEASGLYFIKRSSDDYDTFVRLDTSGQPLDGRGQITLEPGLAVGDFRVTWSHISDTTQSDCTINYHMGTTNADVVEGTPVSCTVVGFPIYSDYSLSVSTNNYFMVLIHASVAPHTATLTYFDGAIQMCLESSHVHCVPFCYNYCGRSVTDDWKTHDGLKIWSTGKVENAGWLADKLPGREASFTLYFFEPHAYCTPDAYCTTPRSWTMDITIPVPGS